MPNRKGVKQPLATYIDVTELNRRLKSQTGPLGRLDAELQIASKAIERGDNPGRVELLVRNASAHARVVFQTCLKLLPNEAQNTRGFRKAVAEDEIIPRLEALQKNLEQKIVFWTPLQSNRAERSVLMEQAQQLMKDLRDGAGWEDQDVVPREKYFQDEACDTRQGEKTERPTGAR